MNEVDPEVRELRQQLEKAEKEGDELRKLLWDTGMRLHEAEEALARALKTE